MNVTPLLNTITFFMFEIDAISFLEAKMIEEHKFMAIKSCMLNKFFI